MSWKIIIPQTCILLAGTFLAIQYFSMPQLSFIEGIQEETASSLAKLNARISHVEQELATLKTTGFHQVMVQQPGNNRGDNKNNPENLRDTEQPRKIDQKIEQLERQITAVSQQQDRLLSYTRQQSSGNNWLSTLPEEKQAEVQEIYQEQLATMEERISSSPGEMPPSPQNMQAILQESRAELRNKLKELLTPEEYARFLHSQQMLPPLPQQ